MSMKHCIKCNKLKELTEYHLCKAATDGHQNTCKECTFARIKQYRKDNLDHVRANGRKWYQDNKKHVLIT